MITGTCACGTMVEREDPVAAEWLARMLREAPLVCPSCVAAAEQEETTRQTRRAAADRFERRVVRSGLPPALHGLAWDHVPASVSPGAVEAAKAWAAGELCGLFLTGPVGVGKTCLAATATWARLELEPVRWYQHGVLRAKLGEDFGSEDRQRAAADLSDTATLILDDLGKAPSSDFAASCVLTAIDQRITAGAGLLVTSNHTLQALLSRFPGEYADAIASRLAGSCRAIEMSGEDLRLLRRGAA